jgi:hypothetical protein
LGLASVGRGDIALPKDHVYPRIFTPNSDGINDLVYFEVVNPSLDTITGAVYDKDGSKVADLKEALGVPPRSGDPYAQMWVWDGRDGNGNIAPAGVYIYEVRGGGRTITGTVVVAK